MKKRLLGSGMARRATRTPWPAGTVGARLDDVRHRCRSLNASLDQLATVLDDASPNVRSHYTLALDALDACLTTLTPELDTARAVCAELGISMGDVMHTWWLVRPHEQPDGLATSTTRSAANTTAAAGPSGASPQALDVSGCPTPS